MRKFFLITAVAVAIAAPALADTRGGVEAWERGDYKTAVDQWRTAAAKGDPDAQFNLGQAYKLGRGVPVDTKKAEVLYRQAADQGHVQAADNYALALFQNGQPRAAIPYLETSSGRGEPRAQYILGTMLFNGVDIKKDWVRAYALLTQSAKSGLPQASQTLTQMNEFIPADQRQKGLALADRMAPPPLPAREVAGGAVTGVRGLDLASAQLSEGPQRTPPIAVATPAPPPQRPTLRPVARSAPPPVAMTSGRWRLQLGAFGDPANARRLGVQMGGRFLGRSVDYVQASALTRVLVGPFATRAEAQAACGSLKPCVPVGP